MCLRPEVPTGILIQLLCHKPVLEQLSPSPEDDRATAQQHLECQRRTVRRAVEGEEQGCIGREGTSEAAPEAVQ